MIHQKNSFTPLFLVLILGISLVVGLNILVLNVWADDASSSVTVTNVVPSFTVDPHEDPASAGTSPTNVGSNVTFKATATDNNNDNYTLLLCKTAGVTGIDCDGGAGDRWCVSSSTTSGSEANCAYTALVGDAESNIWHGYACDATGCSAVSQGTGDSGSPFKVNHRPTFSYQTNCGTVDPGSTCNITTAGEGSTTATSAETAGANVVVEVASTTGFAVNDYVWYAGTTPERTQVEAVAAGVSITLDLANNHAVSDAITEIGAEDTDSDTAADTVSLFVCKAADFTGTVCGAGGTWCSQATQARNPSCDATAPTPSEGAQNYYPYVIDSHSFASTDALQGSAQSYTVNNVVPVVSSVTLNSGSNITLVENTTTNVVATATVSDNNGCGDVDEVTTADVSMYRSGTGWGGCDDSPGAEDNDNYCYSIRDCVYDTGSCTGGSDLSSTFTCTVAMQYHSDPTDVSTQYPTENWLDTVKGCDEALCHNAEVAVGVEMVSLTALNVTSTIAYGNLAPGNASAADQTTIVTATGNVGLDAEYSGVNMTYSTFNIPVAQQKYDLTGGVAWASMTYTLSVTPTEKELNCQKTIAIATPKTKDTYWRLSIPAAQETGTYNGTDTIGAVKGETANW